MAKLDLGAVQETLLLPLAARAYDAESKYPILNDQKALELFKQLVPNRKAFRKNLLKVGIVSLTERGWIIDRAVKDFLKRNPKGKVLNIGAGLETSFYRLGQPNVPWFDLDLPDSLALRKQLLPNNFKNVKYIPKSMFDESWIDDIGNISDGLMITVSGVFPYFDEKQVQLFFNTFAPKLKGTEIIFDVLSNATRFFVQRKINQAGMSKATLDWGIMNPRHIEKWNQHIQFVKAYSYLQHPSFNAIGNPIYNFISWNSKFFKSAQIFHFKFV